MILIGCWEVTLESLDPLLAQQWSQESACFTLRAGSPAFGSFGKEVLEFLRLEQVEVHRELELKEERHNMYREQVSQMPRKMGIWSWKMSPTIANSWQNCLFV